MPHPSATLALARRAVVDKGAAAPALVHGAAHAAVARAATGAQSVSASSLLVQMVVGLVVIIVLIKLASRFVQGRGGRSLGHGPRPHGLSVVGRQSLGKGVQVAMVAAGSQTYLLGVTQRQVTLLGQVDVDGVDAADGAQTSPVAPGALQLLRGGGRGSSPADGPLPGWKSAIEQMRVRTVRRA